MYVAQSAIYPGDPVTLNSAGTVQLAAAGNALLGAAIGQASAGQSVLIADHPDQEFYIQASGSVPGAQSDMLLNYNILPGSPNTTYNISGAQLDSTSQATTATLPLKALRVDNRVNNTLGSANVKVIVAINNHVLKGGTGTAGV
jgi:hypothetical protein